MTSGTLRATVALAFALTGAVGLIRAGAWVGVNKRRRQLKELSHLLKRAQKREAP